ncbi:MAG: glutathione S-transferase family protein [Alphaproteobacteria bacterium]
MRTLIHMWLSPPCRSVRIVLAEKALDFDLAIENVWDRRASFLAINPAGEVPVLQDGDRTVVGAYAIYEYLDEVYPEPTLYGGDPVQRAEIRRLVDWFGAKFAREVSENLVTEKIVKRFYSRGQPDSTAIRAGHANLHYHLDYIGYLTDRRKWLAGDTMSMADIVAAAQLSCIDYLGDVAWNDHPETREWYARVKSRPSFRPLLADHLPGARPPKHYADLDF